MTGGHIWLAHIGKSVIDDLQSKFADEIEDCNVAGLRSMTGETGC